MNCSICGRVIDGPYLTEVTGWIAHRTAGGANAIRAKSETGNVAHSTCVDRRASGLEPIPGQLALVEMPDGVIAYGEV